MSHKIWLLVLVSTLIPLIPFYKISNFTFSKDMMNRNVSDTTSSVSHMLDGQQSSVTKDLAINVNQFETSNITYMILLIWVFGSLLCLFYMIKAFRQIDVIKSSSLESSYLNERLKVCQSKMQFYKKHITISYSSNIDNPMVFGLVKSYISRHFASSRSTTPSNLSISFKVKPNSCIRFMKFNRSTVCGEYIRYPFSVRLGSGIKPKRS